MTRSRKDDLEAAFDPERFRETGHAVVDRLADYLAAALAKSSDPVLPWVDPAAQLDRTKGFEEGPTSDVSTVLDDVLRTTLRLHDPRSMGHQDGVPLPIAALGSFVSSVVNNDPSIYETGPGVVAMEVRLLRWMSDELGFPEEAAGVITSGGSLGNLTALLAARQAKAGFDLWKLGNSAGQSLCVLVSEQAHYCIARSVQMMGWGEDGCIRVPVDDRYRMRVDALPAAMEEARRRERQVIAVVGSSCTTATSAFDPLPEIAEFCEANDLWFHVDGAHGAGAVLSPKYRRLVEGIERADSVVWDGHKMMMMPSLLTAVLFRDGRRSYETFRQEATYLFEDRPSEEWYNAGNRTVECTKPAMSTRLYMALRVHGVGVFRSYITKCFDTARRFAELLDEAPDFELAVPPDGNIVCFRYRADAGADLDRLQPAIRSEIIQGGGYYLTQADLDGRTWLRCTLMNPRTSEAELRGLMDAVREAAGALRADSTDRD